MPERGGLSNDMSKITKNLKESVPHVNLILLICIIYMYLFYRGSINQNSLTNVFKYSNVSEVVKSTSLSLCSCSVSVIVINQNCQKQGKLCKLFLHMPSTEFAHAQLRVNRVCTCSVKGKHETKPSFLG